MNQTSKILTSTGNTSDTWCLDENENFTPRVASAHWGKIDIDQCQFRLTGL